MLALRLLAVLVPALALLSVPVAAEVKGMRSVVAKTAVKAAIVDAKRKNGDTDSKDANGDDKSAPTPVATRDPTPEPVVAAAAPDFVGPPNQLVCLAGCYDSLGRSKAGR